jgi:hypothetical protein
MLEVLRPSESEDMVFTPIIGITDVVEGKTYLLDGLENDLASRKRNFEGFKQLKIAARDLSISSLVTVRRYVKGWGVENSGQNTYFISGYGLGWVGGGLSDGHWVFKLDIGQMSPVDDEGTALSDILLTS